MAEPTRCIDCKYIERIKLSETNWPPVCAITRKRLEDGPKLLERDEDCPRKQGDEGNEGD